MIAFSKKSLSPVRQMEGQGPEERQGDQVRPARSLGEAQLEALSRVLAVATVGKVRSAQICNIF